MYENSFEIETRIGEISEFLLILRDAVENSNDAYYLLNFVEIIYNKTDELYKLIDEYKLT